MSGFIYFPLSCFSWINGLWRDTWWNASVLFSWTGAVIVQQLCPTDRRRCHCSLKFIGRTWHCLWTPSSQVMTTKSLSSKQVAGSNNHYSHVAMERELFILSLQGPTLSATEVTGTTPIFYPGAGVLDGSLEAAGFVSVLRRQRQVDKSQRDVMTHHHQWLSSSTSSSGGGSSSSSAWLRKCTWY